MSDMNNDNPMGVPFKGSTAESVDYDAPDTTEGSVAGAFAELNDDGTGGGDQTQQQGDQTQQQGDQSQLQGQGDQTQQQGDQTQQQDLVAPADWTSDDQAAFNALTPEGKQFVAKQLGAYQTAYQEQMAGLQEHVGLLQNVYNAAQELNVKPDFLVDHFFGTYDTLANGTPAQKKAALKQLANDFGITKASDLRGGENDRQVDPEVAQLKQQLAQVQGHLGQRQTLEQQQQGAAAQAELVAFANAKDENGQLKHPFFGDVLDDMKMLADVAAQNGMQVNLDDLYDQAIHMNPTVRAKVLAANNQAAVNKARRTGASISSSGTGNERQVQPDSIEDSVAAAWEAAAA